MDGSNLDDIRREILKLDLEILDRLHKRLELAEEAGEIKEQKGKDLRDEDREEELLRILTGYTKNQEMVEEVWEVLFKHALKAQGGEKSRGNRAADRTDRDTL